MDKGISTENEKIRKSKEYKNWRLSIFKRDNYTCVICKVKNKKGMGKTIELHADHIKSFAHHKDLRFEIDNGRTLCIDCHRKTENYGVKAKKDIVGLNEQA
jgi:5-methylcytosine-specific restriction endonuclease McrA